MRLRTYLILSYLALIVILFAGAWFIDAHTIEERSELSAPVRIAGEHIVIAPGSRPINGQGSTWSSRSGSLVIYRTCR